MVGMWQDSTARREKSFSGWGIPLQKKGDPEVALAGSLFLGKGR
jgi:hypothetical protein